VSIQEIPEILADRLNIEPVIFRGLSNTELVMVVKVSLGIWAPICIIVAGILGNFAMGFGVAMVLVILSVLVAGTLLQKIKRGRPRFYYQHQMKLAWNKIFAKKELTDPKGVIKHTGNWSLGRSTEWDK